MTGLKISRRRKAVVDGIFKAEVHEFLASRLKETGFSGVEVRITPVKTYIIIKATRPRDVLGPDGRNLRELSSLIQQRFNFEPKQIELLTERLRNRALSAIAQAESLRYKLLKGIPARRSCYTIIRSVMEANAKGCEISISGKLRAQRAKTMKFKDGYMISKGNPANYYIQQAIRTVAMKQGILGLKVKIMLPYDPSGEDGPRKALPDHVVVFPPKAQDPTGSEVHIISYTKDKKLEAAGGVAQPVASA